MAQLERGRVQTYLADEFVVAAEHRLMVLDLLGAQRACEIDTASDLGLTLIGLSKPEEALAHVRTLRRAIRAPEPEGPADKPTLDALLEETRAYFGHEYGRWAPTLGKNRVVSGVQVAPYPSVGGPQPGATGAMPTPAKSGRLPRAGAGSPGQGVRVGLLDTGLFEHEDLAGRYTARRGSLIPASTRQRYWWQQRPPWRSSSLPQWWRGHATHVAGIILGRAPGAELTVDTVLAGDGLGGVADAEQGFGSSWSVARRLAAYANTGADVVNCSFCEFTDDGKEPLVLARAIQRVLAHAVVVAAAGNHGPEISDAERARRNLPSSCTPAWPAACDGVVAVGASNEAGQKASFTPVGPWVNLLAPGVDIASTYLDERVRILKGLPENLRPRRFKGWACWSGTSFSAAAVSGAIAARTEPGRRTARDALDDLVANAAGPGGPSGFRVLTPPV